MAGLQPRVPNPVIFQCLGLPESLSGDGSSFLSIDKIRVRFPVGDFYHSSLITSLGIQSKTGHEMGRIITAGWTWIIMVRARVEGIVGMISDVRWPGSARSLNCELISLANSEEPRLRPVCSSWKLKVRDYGHGLRLCTWIIKLIHEAIMKVLAPMSPTIGNV